MKLVFSDTLLAGLAGGDSRGKRHFVDLAQRGLVFELTPSGGYFHFRYTFCGRQKLLSLGKHGETDVAAARTKAGEFAHLLLDGVDPAVARGPPEVSGATARRTTPGTRCTPSCSTSCPARTRAAG